MVAYPFFLDYESQVVKIFLDANAHIKSFVYLHSWLKMLKINFRLRKHNSQRACAKTE